MKRFLLTAAILLGSFTMARAQDDLPDDEGKKMEKIQALYVAYITKELNLTADDAQKFWPVHAEFDRELRGVKNDLPELERQQRVLDIKKRYQERFTRVLGSNRTENFFRKDGEFRRKLVERLRKMRQNRQNMPPRQRRGALGIN
jgi:hypothetical protein